MAVFSPNSPDRSTNVPPVTTDHVKRQHDDPSDPSVRQSKSPTGRAIGPRKAPMPLKIDTSASPPPNNDSSEICLSPSWSDHGEKARRKERKRQEKEIKNAERAERQMRERQRSTDRKSHRLSKKPPPAAMETQRLPTELRSSSRRRNSVLSLISGQSSPQLATSRSDSNEEKRFSGTSWTSIIAPGRRSQSKNRRSTSPARDSIDTDRPVSSHSAGSWTPVVDPVAPRLPGFRWTSSKRLSFRKDRSQSSSASELGLPDMVGYAYQPEDSAIELDDDDDWRPRSQTKIDLASDGNLPERPHPGIRKSATDPLLSGPFMATQSTARVDRPMFRHSQDAMEAPQKAELQYPINDISTEKIPIDGLRASPPETMSEAPDLARMSTSSLLQPHLDAQPSLDGSSYVYRHRMTQQQRSIASFVENEALKSAHEQAAAQSSEPKGQEVAEPTMTARASEIDGELLPPPDRAPDTASSDGTSWCSNGSTRRSSASPVRRPSHFSQNVSSPLKSVTQAPVKTVRHQLPDDEPVRTLKRAGRSIPQLNSPSRTEKILGFRRNKKDASSPQRGPLAEKKLPLTPDEIALNRIRERERARDNSVEKNPRKSRARRLSQQMATPFRSRRNSEIFQKSDPSDAELSTAAMQNAEKNRGRPMSSAEVLKQTVATDGATAKPKSAMKPIQPLIVRKSERALNDEQSREGRPPTEDDAVAKPKHPKSAMKPAPIMTAHQSEILNRPEESRQVAHSDLDILPSTQAAPDRPLSSPKAAKQVPIAAQSKPKSAMKPAPIVIATESPIANHRESTSPESETSRVTGSGSRSSETRRNRRTATYSTSPQIRRVPASPTSDSPPKKRDSTLKPAKESNLAISDRDGELTSPTFVGISSKKRESILKPTKESELSLSDSREDLTALKSAASSSKKRESILKPEKKFELPDPDRNGELASPRFVGSQSKKRESILKPAKEPELIISNTNGEGIVRQTSITRPRSNPLLQTLSKDDDGLPNVDFLPQLKHQPLKSPKRPQTQRQSTPKFTIPVPPPQPSTAYQSPVSANNKSKSSSTSDLALMPRSPFRLHHSNSSSPINPVFARSSTSSNIMSSSTTSSSTSGASPAGSKLSVLEGNKPIAKLFVICCKCKFWHDLPSKLYEAMALPKEIRRRESRAASSESSSKGKEAEGRPSTKTSQSSPESNKSKPTPRDIAQGRLDTAVKCPWCEHAMTTWCCAGWTTVVYMHERHH